MGQNTRDRQLACHKNCDGFRDIYGRMAWDDVAPTITSGMTFSGSTKQNVQAMGALDVDLSVGEFFTKSISALGAS